MSDPDATPEVYEFLMHGIEPSDTGDLDITITEELFSPPGTPVKLEPERVGTDLVFNITEDVFADPDYAEFSVNLADQDGNPLADIERVIFNIDASIEGQFFAPDLGYTSSNDLAGTETQEIERIELIRGPDDLDGAPLVAFNIFDDDSTYFDVHDPDTTSEDDPPRVLEPFESLGTLDLGRLFEVFDRPDLTDDTRNPVEVIITRV